MNSSYGPPRHVAIIMDGTGRWAEKRGLPRIEGHRAAIRIIRPLIKVLDRHGVSFVTLYTFSTENWRRPEDEVNGLMELLKSVIGKEARELHKNNVRIRHIGSSDRLSRELKNDIQRAVKMTARNTGMTLAMAFNYGGRAEIVQAVRGIIAEGLTPEEIDELCVEKHLYTAGMPDVDLVIRTSGEMRTSNFLIWQAAYAEYYFTSVLFPDFDEQELEKALEAYGQRKRRFGGLESREEC